MMKWSVLMVYRRRIYFTDKQKAEIWDRGEAMRSIGQLFDRSSSSIYSLLSKTGDIRPPERKRSRLSLTLVERENISRGIVALRWIRSIARELCRSALTVSREIKRNGGYADYRAVDTDTQAWERSLRPKLCKLAIHKHLQGIVTDKLVIH